MITYQTHLLKKFRPMIDYWKRAETRTDKPPPKIWYWVIYDIADKNNTGNDEVYIMTACIDY